MKSIIESQWRLIIFVSILVFLCAERGVAQSDPSVMFNIRTIDNRKIDKKTHYLIGNWRYRIKSLSFIHDNDLFAFSFNNDDSYTGAFLIQINSTPILEQFFFRYKLPNDDGSDEIDKDYEYDGVQTSVDKTTYISNESKFEMGGLVFTPFDIESSAVVQEDRPYGSFHYMSLGFNSTILKRQNLIVPKTEKNNAKYSYLNSKILYRTVSSQLYIGTIGGQGASVFQSWSHRFLPRETPNGWHNQIGGGKRRLAINYRISQRFMWGQSNVRWMVKTYKNKFSKKPEEKSIRTFIPVALHVMTDFNFGNYTTNLAGGLRAHFLEFNRGARLLKEGNPIYEGLELSNKRSFYAYIQGMVRAVVFDSMLQGNLFNDQSIHTIDYRQMEPLRYELSGGIAFTLWRNISLFGDINFRSREFRGGKPFHLYSRVGAKIRFDPKFTMI